MKGVILAGGTGSRLMPLTAYLNKHLLPIGPYPMIHYAVMKLREAGIREILLIINAQSAQLYAEYLGSGKQYDVELTYRIQEQAGGIAEAAALAEPYIRSENGKFALMLGDNLFEDSIRDAVEQFNAGDEQARVFLKKVKDPSRYGVPQFDESGRILRIEEKPRYPKSDYCVTGLYLYDVEMFDIIRQLEPSERGELEITDVNDWYAQRGALAYSVLSGWWIDAGTHESLREAVQKITGDGEEGA